MLLVAAAEYLFRECCDEQRESTVTGKSYLCKLVWMLLSFYEIGLLIVARVFFFTGVFY